MHLKIDKRLKLKDKLVEYIQKLRSDHMEAPKFYDKIREKIIEFYQNLFIPDNKLLSKLINKNQICSIFTFLEDYKVTEVDFYKRFFIEYIKEEKSFPVGLESFNHLMQAVKLTFLDKLLKGK